MLTSFFTRHAPGRVALQLSFGKDSAACLWLCQPWWDRLVVVWGDAGYPSQAAVDYMEWVKGMVPNFASVLGDQRRWVRENGYPTDILPVEATAIGRTAEAPPAIKLSFVGDCCAANLWQPMSDYLKAGGFTGVIRGQKLADSLRTDLRSGDVHDGIEYCLPVEGWSDEEVFAYLGHEFTPSPYSEGLTSSLDCLNCTAYSSHRKGVQAYLDRHSPFVGQEVRIVRKEIARLARHHIKLLEEDS